MGLNYSYVLLVEQLHEPELLAYLAQTGTVTRESYEVCVSIDFPLDEAVLDYQNRSLVDYTKWCESRNKQPNHRNFFPTSTAARIGCIYLEIRSVPGSSRCYVDFSAATSSMRRLFQISGSIRSWFLGLGELLEATAVFLYQEAEGFLLIRKQGRDLAITLPEAPEDMQVQNADQQAAVDICGGYYELLW